MGINDGLHVHLHAQGTAFVGYVSREGSAYILFQEKNIIVLFQCFFRSLAEK